MKHLMTLSAAGLLTAALPALAMAQTTPQNQRQTTPPSQPQQTMPQQMQQRGTPMQKNSPMRPSTTGARQEVATAHAHALMAQNAKTLKQTKQHLQHVLNCLEGRSGANYDADAGNPCKGKGQGAIPDSTSNPAMQTRLKSAVTQAQQGLQADDLQQAHTIASKVAGLLQAQPMTPKGMMRQPVH